MSDKKERHPSYGIIQFGRIQCGGDYKLFGSSYNQHPTVIRLTLKRCEVDKSGVTKSYFPREPLFTVDLSASQFAELLTTINYGSGIPCTIKGLNGESVDPPEDHRTEDQEARDDFGERMRELEARVSTALDDYEDILRQKGRIKKDDREKVLSEVSKFLQDLRSNIPYMIELYNEATDKVKSNAKAEMDAYLSHSIAMTGLSQLESELEGHDTLEITDQGDEDS